MADPIYLLSGVDPNDPTPGVKREIRTNAGASSGSGQTRAAVIIADKLTSVGSASLDGLGQAVETPILITQGEQQVVNMAGMRSEALELYRDFVKVNNQTALYLCLVGTNGSGAAAFTVTFANAADKNGSIAVTYGDETIYVAVTAGDAIATMAANLATAINAQPYWMVTAAAALGVTTVTCSTTGTRFSYQLTQMTFTMTVPQTTTTMTKSAVSGATTDDDFTNSLNALALTKLYYQVNPKVVTIATTSTDLGIGQHAAMIATQANPTNGKNQIMVFAMTGTNAQAVTTATSVNYEAVRPVWSNTSPISNGRLATRYAAGMALAEITDPAANLVNMGLDPLKPQVSFPWAPAVVKPTTTEIKAALNNGFAPIAFNAQNKGFLVMSVTSRTLTNSVQDYRCRLGHIISVAHDFDETVQAVAGSQMQPKCAADLQQGELPLPGFSYPADMRAIIRSVIDLKATSSPVTLDPGQRDYMKSTVSSALLVNGFSNHVQIRAVRHNNKQTYLYEETSPQI